MCPTGIVLTDSPYDSATDTLAEKRVQKYGKSQKWCSLRMKKNPQPKPLPELRIYTPKLLPIGKTDKLHR